MFCMPNTGFDLASHCSVAEQRQKAQLCRLPWSPAKVVTEVRNAELFHFRNPTTKQWLSVVMRRLCLADMASEFASFHFRLGRLEVEEFWPMEHPFFTLRVPA